MSARFGSIYTKIGTIQKRLAWPLRKDDTQIREAFHIKETNKQTNTPPPPPKKEVTYERSRKNLCG